MMSPSRLPLNLNLIPLAFRNLLGHKKSYRFVVLILVLGFAIGFLATSLTQGMHRTAQNRALQHYGGHIFIHGRDRQAGSLMVMDQEPQIRQALDSLSIPHQGIFARFHLFDRATLVSQGKALGVKDLFGIHFDQEAELLSSLPGLELSQDLGSSPDFSTLDPNGIFLSAAMAKHLGLNLEDEVLLRLETRRRQTETHRFLVKGILEDSTLYGYSRAFVWAPVLAQLVDASPATHSTLSILLSDPSQSGYWVEQIHQALSRVVEVSQPITSRRELTREIRRSWQGVRYFVFDLPVYIGEITDLLFILELGTYLLLGMIILIIAAAGSVTFRVVLSSRIREIGTLLALGYTRTSVFIILSLELLFLLVPASFVGLLLSLFGTWAIGNLNLAILPGMELLLVDGSIAGVYFPRGLGFQIFLVALGLVPTSLVSAGLYVKREIPQLLRGQLT